MTDRLNSAVIVGGAIAALGLFAGYFSLQIPAASDGGTGARLFPYMGAGALLLLGLIEVRKGFAESGSPMALTERPVSILGLLALAVAYVWLISTVGYLISTAAVAPLAMWLFGMRNPLALMATAILCPAVYHYLFFELLGVFPPYGEWFDLLDVLQGS